MKTYTMLVARNWIRLRCITRCTQIICWCTLNEKVQRTSATNVKSPESVYTYIDIMQSPDWNHDLNVEKLGK